MSGNLPNDLLKYIKECKILYVEDDISAQEEIAFFLEKRAKELFIASNGEEGLELFKKYRPDIVITDIQMPKLNGLEMASAIKEIDPEIPVIVTTAFTDSNYLFKAIEIEISDYLPKPVDLLFMTEKIAKIAKNIFLKREIKKTRRFLHQYQEAIDKSTLFLKTDKDGKIIFCNDTFANLMKFDKDELINRDYFSLCIDNIKDKFIKEIKNKKNYKTITRYKAKNGALLYLKATFTPITDLKGNIIEIIAIHFDITKIVELTKEIYHTQTKLLFTLGEIMESRSKESSKDMGNISIRNS